MIVVIFDHERERCLTSTMFFSDVSTVPVNVPVTIFAYSYISYLGNHGESKQVADAAEDSDEDLSAVTLP